MPLTDTRIRTAKASKKPYRLTDSAGLCLEVKPNGSKLWRLRYRIGGKENMFALGEYGDRPGQCTLADARTERDRARKLVKQGIHPAHSRQALKSANIAEGANTFEAVAREWIAKQQGRWSPYYFSQVERVLKRDVYPYIGSLPVRSVTAAHVLAIIKRLEKGAPTKKGAPTVALLVRQWCSAVFRYAVATLRADGDPVVALKGAIQRPKVRHRKPLSRADIAPFLAAVGKYGGYRTTVIALRLLMLTFVRPTELRAAAWTELDLDRAEWRISAERMKMREAHVVPLSLQAVELLGELKTLTGGQRWLFPNHRRPRSYMTATTLNRALERMGYAGKFSAHGFRATASTMLNEMGYRPDVIERQLAHKERNAVRAAYNQAQYLAERRDMMQAWASCLDSLVQGANVTPIKRATA
jgi:integrase